MWLVVGYGNSLRGDDGAGNYVAQRLDEVRLAGVDVRIVQQLHTELVEEAVRYGNVLLVDAVPSQEEPVIRRVVPGKEPVLASSHHFGPELLYRLAQTLYRKDLNLFVCAVPGRDFTLSDQLTSEGKAAADRAVEMVKEFILHGK